MAADTERAWISGRAGVRHLPDSVWDLVISLGYLARWKRGDISAEDVVRFVTEMLSYVDHAGPIEIAAQRAAAALPYADVVALASQAREEEEHQDEEPGSVERPRLEDRELERARALGEFVAYLAAMHPSVQRFRMFVLGDYVLSREAVWELQDSPGGRRRILGPDGVGASSGFLDELEQAGRRVAEYFRGYWSPEEAVEFILADRVAWRCPAKATIGNPFGEPASYGTVTLEVEPWVPSATVAKLYQHEQMRMLGQRPRALSLRNVLVVRFVFTKIRAMWYARLAQEVRSARGNDTEFSWYEGIMRMYDQGVAGTPEGPLWRPLMDQWNEMTGGKPYESEVRFRRDFYRTARVLTSTFGTKSYVLDGDESGVHSEK